MRVSETQLRKQLMAVCFIAGIGSLNLWGQAHPRLTIVNGCSEPIWVFYTIGPGGGSLAGTPPADPTKLTSNQSVSYQIPDAGLASTRFWPAMGCDDNGNNCNIGQSGGPGLVCPSEGCAPPVDSKFEGTFGCMTGVQNCQTNPSNGEPLTATDWWDTSQVDGFTLPYKVEVTGTCAAGPKNQAIDCTKLEPNLCPARENLSSDGKFKALDKENLNLTHPGTHAWAGCYSPASKLTMNNWGNAPTFSPGAAQAQWYACPTPPMSSAQCKSGPVVKTDYVKAVHKYCPGVYAWAYDDVNGLYQCNASTGTSYTVTYYCPAHVLSSH